MSFVDLDKVIGVVPGAVVVRLRRVDTGRGSEALYRDQLPALLTALTDRARIESITASSALEGVIVPDQARAERIIAGKAGTLRNRSEQQLAGYRAALDYLFIQNWRPLNIGLLLHLHRLLFSETEGGGGSFKTSDNLVVDRWPDGSQTTRFVPVPANRTEYYTGELITRYNEARRSEKYHPLLLVGLFILDALIIHPFDDGNGRVVRALTNALLDDAGYGVCKYVSMESLVEASADDYYASLLDSTHEWQNESHDPWPWLSYFVDVVARAYDTFEARAAAETTGGTKQDRVRTYVTSHAPTEFSVSSVRRALPGISDQTIRIVLEALKSEGVVAPQGTGRSATWKRRA